MNIIKITSQPTKSCNSCTHSGTFQNAVFILNQIRPKIEFSSFCEANSTFGLHLNTNLLHYLAHCSTICSFSKIKYLVSKNATFSSTIIYRVHLGSHFVTFVTCTHAPLTTPFRLSQYAVRMSSKFDVQLRKDCSSISLSGIYFI